MGLIEQTLIKKFIKEKNVQIAGSNITLNQTMIKASSVYYDTWYNRNEMFLISTNATNEGVLRSTNFGNTWEKVFQRAGISGANHRGFYRSRNGYGLVWTADGNLCRTTTDFTQAETFTDMYQPLSITNGIDEHPTVNLIMYGEYGGAGGINGKRIWKSVDNGATWSVALEDTAIGHWHFCQRDPYTGYWYAGSGDSDAGVKIMQSKDDGVTWAQIAGGSQEYRACSLQFSEEYIYWVPDYASAPAGTVKLYKIHKDNINSNWDTNRIDISTNIEGPCYGMIKTKDGRFCFWTAAENREMSKLYLTDGVNCKQILSTNRYPNTSTLLAGFSGMSKPDSNNRVLITTNACEFNQGPVAYVATLPLGIDLN